MPKSVELSEEAYHLLSNAKRPGESFSDVVVRLTGRRSLLDLRGLRSPERIEAAQRMMREIDEGDPPRPRHGGP